MRHSSSLSVEQALEFRVPMPVTNILRLEYDGDFPICPRCHISLEREYMNFCDHCGQKLGWHGYKNAKVIYPSLPSM